MKTIIEIIQTLIPLGIGICSLLGVGSIGKIILKSMEYKNAEKIRKEKQAATINSNFKFYMKLFDKIAENIKLWHSEQIKQGMIKEYDYSVKMTITDFDDILGQSIVNFNAENGYFDIEDQINVTRPLQSRGLY
jgi:hypothetical protein